MSSGLVHLHPSMHGAQGKLAQCVVCLSPLCPRELLGTLTVTTRACMCVLVRAHAHFRTASARAHALPRTLPRTPSPVCSTTVSLVVTPLAPCCRCSTLCQRAVRPLPRLSRRLSAPGLRGALRLPGVSAAHLRGVVLPHADPVHVVASSGDAAPRQREASAGRACPRRRCCIRRCHRHGHRAAQVAAGMCKNRGQQDVNSWW
jgi:hypothetical protein